MADKQRPAFIDRLTEALTRRLGDVGIPADVDSEPVPSTRLHRVFAMAQGFQDLGHSERQSLVWRIAEQVLSPDELLHVSMILTLTPEEAGIEVAAARPEP